MKTTEIVTRVNDKLKADFKAKCKLNNTTQSQKVRDLITEWVKKKV